MTVHNNNLDQGDDSKRRAQEFATQLASNQETEQPSLSAPTSVLPKIGLALGGATLATLAWFSFSSRSEIDASSVEPYTISGSREDTKFYFDSTQRDSFNDIRPAHFKKALAAFNSGNIPLGFANLLTATASLEIGAFDVIDTDGNTIIKFQLIRYEHVPTHKRDDIEPEEISYLLSLEDIPGSPYTLARSSHKDPITKILRAGKHVSNLVMPRDESGSIKAIIFETLEGNEISRYNFVEGLIIEATQERFTNRAAPELAIK